MFSMHKVRHFFLLACMLMAVVLVALSWKMVFKMDIHRLKKWSLSFNGQQNESVKMGLTPLPSSKGGTHSNGLSNTQTPSIARAHTMSYMEWLGKADPQNGRQYNGRLVPVYHRKQTKLSSPEQNARNMEQRNSITAPREQRPSNNDTRRINPLILSMNRTKDPIDMVRQRMDQSRKGKAVVTKDSGKQKLERSKVMGLVTKREQAKQRMSAGGRESNSLLVKEKELTPRLAGKHEEEMHDGKRDAGGRKDLPRIEKPIREKPQLHHRKNDARETVDRFRKDPPREGSQSARKTERRKTGQSATGSTESSNPRKDKSSGSHHDGRVADGRGRVADGRVADGRVTDGRVAEDKGTDERGNRKDSCQHCFHTNFPILIDQPDFCDDLGDNTIVLLLISSSPSNRNRRRAIRKTWGERCSNPDSSYRCLFVLGDPGDSATNTKLRQENNTHHDLIQFAFTDAYVNLTYKTMTSLRWVSERCRHKVSYVMKTDDDMYVNSLNLPVMLQAAPTRNFVGGFCWGNSPPNRDQRSKWFVPRKQYLRPLFPPMCSGTGYVMSADVVDKVLTTSQGVPFFHLEDVYVALCLNRLGVRPVKIAGFHNTRVDVFDGCHFRRHVMTSHDTPEFLLYDYWPQVLQCSKPQPSAKDLFVTLPLFPI